MVVHSPFVLGDIVTGPETATITTPKPDDPTLAQVTMIARADDVDRDGVPDLVLDVDAIGRGLQTSVAAPLVLRNLASGMSPDTAAVSREVVRLEQLARRELERSPARALGHAMGALALAQAVCPEASSPAVHLGRAPLRCDLRGSLAKAQVDVVVALLRTRETDGAATRLLAAEALGTALDESALRLVTRALESAATLERPDYQPLAADDAGVLVEPLFAPGASRLDASTTDLPPRRFGRVLWFRHDQRSRLIRLPDAPDAGRPAECVVASDAGRIACRLGDGIVFASLGRPS